MGYELPRWSTTVWSMPATGGDNDPYFDAVRILLLLNAAARPLAGIASTEAPPDAVAVLTGEGRLQKLDFWLRYPDYLADELLTDYETSREPFLLQLAAQILDSEEPELRSIPMLRYKFGAYEPLDMALSILVSEGLVARDPLVGGRRIRRNNYYLTALGHEVAESTVTEFPELAWYGARVRVVVALGQRQLQDHREQVQDSGCWVPPERTWPWRGSRMSRTGRPLLIGRRPPQSISGAGRALTSGPSASATRQACSTATIWSRDHSR